MWYISHPQCILLLEATRLPNEDVSAGYVATRVGDFRETCKHFHLFVTGGQTVSTCDRVAKPGILNLSRAQEREIEI